VRRLDVTSTLLLVAAIVPLVLALSLDPASLRGGAPVRFGLIVATVVMLTLFSFRSLRIEHPIIDLRLFENRVFAIASVALFLFGAAMFGVIIFLPLFLVNVVGVSATRAGISLIPLSLGLVFGSVVGGQLTTRFGRYKPLMLAGESVLLVGVVLLARMPADVSYARVTVYMVLCGAGLGPTFPLFPLAVQNAVDSTKIGQSTSAAQFFRQIGGLVGAAGLGALLGFGLVGALRSELAGIPGAEAARGASVGRRGVDVLLGRVRASVDVDMQKRAALVEDAARAGDGEALERAVLDDDAKTRKAARDVLAAPEETRASSLALLRAELEREAEAILSRVANGIRNAFAVAVTRVYGCVAGIVALGWLVTWLLPELPLRKTHR
jgi:MFS family permease